MKKLVLIGMMTLSTIVFASNIQLDKEFNFKVGYINIRNSGLKSGSSYGIEYVVNRKLKSNTWGIRISLENDDIKLYKENGNGTRYYTEFSFVIALSYTFNHKLRAYEGIKEGYIVSSNNANSDGDFTGGHIITGIVGAEYPVMKHLMIGLSAEQGYIYAITKYNGYLGYKF